MILDRLVLKNFKRFRDAEIFFKDGITGVLGNNGTGKSSLVQAIFFALYGVQATGISADYVVSSFASQKRSARSGWSSGSVATIIRLSARSKKESQRTTMPVFTGRKNSWQRG